MFFFFHGIKVRTYIISFSKVYLLTMKKWMFISDKKLLKTKNYSETLPIEINFLRRLSILSFVFNFLILLNEESISFFT